MIYYEMQSKTIEFEYILMEGKKSSCTSCTFDNYANYADYFLQMGKSMRPNCASHTHHRFSYLLLEDFYL